MNLEELAKTLKTSLDEDPDLIIETSLEEGKRLIICRTGLDSDEYRVSLERQIEILDDDGEPYDEECEPILETDSELTSIASILQTYLDEGGDIEEI